MTEALRYHIAMSSQLNEGPTENTEQLSARRLIWELTFCDFTGKK